MVITDTGKAFIEDVRGVFASTDDPYDQATRVLALTRDAFADGDWLADEVAAAEGGPNILHVDDEFGYPEPGFLVMCPTGEPGETRGGSHVHDHGPTWVVYANYRGTVEHTKYRWNRDDPGNPRLEVEERFTLGPGDITFIMPGEVHRTETVGDETSWVVRIESQQLATVQRHWYDIEEQAVEVEA